MEYATGQQLTRRQSTVWRALRAAAPQTIPVLAGYFVLGMGYGIYVQSLGLPVWMPKLMGMVVEGSRKLPEPKTARHTSGAARPIRAL